MTLLIVRTIQVIFCYAMTSSLLCQNIFLNKPLSSTLHSILFFSLYERTSFTFTYSWNSRQNITFYFFIFIFVNRKGNDKMFWKEWWRVLFESILLLISSCMQFLFILFLSKYLQFVKFQKNLFPIFIVLRYNSTHSVYLQYSYLQHSNKNNKVKIKYTTNAFIIFQ